MSNDDTDAPETDTSESEATAGDVTDTTATETDTSGTPPADGEVYCRDCGAAISEKAEICPECGVRQQSPPSSMDDVIDVLTNGENPFVAAVYSALLPGLGQFYNREPAKGAFIIIATIAATITIIGIVLLPFIWLYAVYDAYVVADGREPPLGS